MATLRLFIAIEIPSAIKAHLASVIRELKASHADVRWDQTEKLHITLKFLGDTEESQLAEVTSSLAQIADKTPPFVIKYSTVGCFPNKREPKILWVGVEDLNSTLQPLAGSIESSMASLGLEEEQKKFHPHVTIGRVKSQLNMRYLLRTMESITFESQPTEVSQIVVTKSELQHSGSVYTTLSKIPLHRQSV